MKRMAKLNLRALLILSAVAGFASSLHAQTLELSHTMSAASSGVVSAVFSPSGQELLTGDGSGAVQIWNANEGKLIKSFQTKLSNLHSVAWSPDSSIIIGAGCGSDEYVQDEVQVWARGKGTWLRTLSTTKKQKQSTCVNSVAFSPDGKILASSMSIQEGNEDGDPSRGAIVLWSTNTGKAIKIFQETGDVERIAFSPDGKTLVCGSNTITGYRPDDTPKFRATVSLWAVGSGKRIRALGHPNAFVSSLSFSPNGKTVALGYHLYGKNPEISTGEVKMWDTQTGKMIGRLANLSSGVSATSFSSDARWIVTANNAVRFGESAGSDVKIWDVKTAKPVLSEQTDENVRAVVFSPDDSMLVTGGFPPLKQEAGGKLESFNSAQFKGVIKVWDFNKETSP
jgi:WD40 repeat protein